MNPYPTDQTAKDLNILLASLVDFYYTYKHYHWNLKHPDFFEFHKLFDEHASKIYESQDIIAERVRQMGEIITGDIEFYAKATLLKTKLVDKNDLNKILAYLVEWHNVIIALLEKIIHECSEIKDFSTADLLTSILEEHQQMRWFLVASIEK